MPMTSRSRLNRMRNARANALLRQMRGVGAYDDLQAKGGIFRHDGPRYPYEALRTRSYNDGSLGQEDTELLEGMRRLTIVVGCTGLLVAGILFNQVLQQAKSRA